MFNQASSYEMRFKAEMVREFKKRWPAIAGKNFEVQFSNGCNDYKYGDCVKVSGRRKNPKHKDNPYLSEYEELFYVFIGRLYGNCGAANPAEMWVRFDCQKKGIGDWLTKWVTNMLVTNGYTVAYGTTINSMQPMAKLLERNGWKQVPDLGFTNRRTNNPITFWVLDVPAVRVTEPVEEVASSEATFPEAGEDAVGPDVPSGPVLEAGPAPAVLAHDEADVPGEHPAGDPGLTQGELQEGNPGVGHHSPNQVVRNARQLGRAGLHDYSNFTADDWSRVIGVEPDGQLNFASIRPVGTPLSGDNAYARAEATKPKKKRKRGGITEWVTRTFSGRAA